MNATCTRVCMLRDLKKKAREYNAIGQKRILNKVNPS